MRDQWGHGMLCGTFPFMDTYSTPGVPVMWMLLSSGMEATSKFFLDFVKMYSPEITPKITMSDRNQAQMNAIKAIYPDTTLLLCW